jgi:molybdenum cofactor cytidylyltransferase
MTSGVSGQPQVACLVLAAGAASRFGQRKLLAPFGGRPLLQHVLDTVAATPLGPSTVVLGTGADEIEAAIRWRDEVRIVNPDPLRGLSSSLQVGLEAIVTRWPDVAGAVIVLGDQPRTRAAVIEALLAAAETTDRPIVAPRYADDGGINPVLIRRAAFDLADRATGDRGLGPVLAAEPDLVAWVDVGGSNPDVDTPADLAALVEASWAERVVANREQVDRFREVPDGRDFYGPVSDLFHADPGRTDEPALELLRAQARPGDTWLDIGAGAGRYALPIARLVREVIAVDPSVGMLEALRAQMAEHGVANVRAIEGRWPLEPGSDAAEALGPFPVADVALIAHVGYDIEAIGPFVDAMEAAVRRRCVALLMERQPSSLADPCWPVVHGEERVALPALPDFVELLRARGRDPSVTMVERRPRRFTDREALEGFLRRQLWIAPDGPKAGAFAAAVDAEIVEDPDGGVGLAGQPPLSVGAVVWTPGPADWTPDPS